MRTAFRHLGCAHVACSTGLNPAKPLRGVCVRLAPHPPNLDGKPARVAGPASKAVGVHQGMCFDYTAVRQIRRVKQSGCCTRLETAGCPHGHDLRVVCSPPIWGDPRSEVPASKAGKLGATPSRPAKPFRCGLLASQLRSERSPRRFDPCRLIQYTSSGLPASPLGFEPKARRFDSCLVFRPRLRGCHTSKRNRLRSDSFRALEE